MTDETTVHRKKFDLALAIKVLGVIGIILPAISAICYPALKGFLSVAVAAEVRQQVREQVAPLGAAMRVLLEGQTMVLEDEIASMEFRRDRIPGIWTENDARELLAKQRRLIAARSALTAMAQATKDQR